MISLKFRECRGSGKDTNEVDERYRNATAIPRTLEFLGNPWESWNSNVRSLLRNQLALTATGGKHNCPPAPLFIGCSVSDVDMDVHWEAQSSYPYGRIYPGSVTCTRLILTNPLIASTVVPLNLKLFCQSDGRACVVEATICRTIHQQMRRPGYGPTH